MSSASQRIEEFKKNYIELKPSISAKRAAIFTESHKQTEGQAVIIRRAKAFKAVCEQIPATIFDGELVVGAIGEFRKAGIEVEVIGLNDASATIMDELAMHDQPNAMAKVLGQ